MEFRREEMGDGVLKVVLVGSFDLAGAAEVDLPFSVVGGSRDKVLVDFNHVSFLASMGVRVLVKAAKAIDRRGGKMIVVGASDSVRKVLVATGVDTLIPMVESETAGRAMLD